MLCETVYKPRTRPARSVGSQPGLTLRPAHSRIALRSTGERMQLPRVGRKRKRACLAGSAIAHAPSPAWQARMRARLAASKACARPLPMMPLRPCPCPRPPLQPPRMPSAPLQKNESSHVCAAVLMRNARSPDLCFARLRSGSAVGLRRLSHRSRVTAADSAAPHVRQPRPLPLGTR